MINKLLIISFFALFFGCKGSTHIASKYPVTGSLNGVYIKKDGHKNIFLSLEKINDSIYYFRITDFDTTNPDHINRDVNGTLLFNQNDGIVINSSTFPYYHFKFKKRNNDTVTIIDADFEMFYAFADIKGSYQRTDSSVINSAIVTFGFPNINETYDTIKAKKRAIVELYDYPTIFSNHKTITINVNENVKEIETVGAIKGHVPFPAHILKFTLIQLDKKPTAKGWISYIDYNKYFQSPSSR